MSKPIPVPLFSPIANRNRSYNKDAHLINAYAEKGQHAGKDDGNGEVHIYKRPGLKFLSHIGAGNGLGVTNWRTNIYSIFGTTLYKDGVNKGTVDASSSYTFTSCLGAVPKLFLKNLNHAYNYDDVNGLVEVTDVNYIQPTVRGCAYLDGTTYVMTPSANINGDNFNDPTTWDPLNTLIVQIEPDPPQCLAKQLVYAIAIKTISTEVFYDAGNPTGSPLGAVQGSKLGVGTRAPTSVVQCGDDLAWLGTTNEGSIQAMFMSKVKGDAISTMPVERLMQGLNYTNVYAWVAKTAGHRFYVITFTNSNFTLAFDLSAQAWYIWQDPSGNYVPIVSSTYDQAANAILQHETNGNLYTFDPNTFQDDGVTFTTSIFTNLFDGGLRTEKTCTTVEVVGDQAPTTVNVSWTDDDYQTFSTPRPADMNSDRPAVDDGSTFRKRAFLLTHTDNTALRVKALNITIAGSAVS